MNAKISFAILNLVAAGIELSEAVDTVLGVGTFAAIASDLHDALNA